MTLEILIVRKRCWVLQEWPYINLPMNSSDIGMIILEHDEDSFGSSVLSLKQGSNLSYASVVSQCSGCIT